MANSTNVSSKDAHKNSFWRKPGKSLPGSIKPVYGAQHPPRHESGPNSPKKNSLKTKNSFQDFQQTTDDAWDSGEDDIISMTNVKMSLRDVQVTALQVISNHSAQMASQAARVGPQSDPDDGNPLPAVHSRLAARANSDDTDTADRVQQQMHKPVISGGSSAPSTPVHAPRTTPPSVSRSGGPGVGVRQQGAPGHQHPISQLGSVSPPDREATKRDKFASLLKEASISLDDLRTLSWSGIPKQYRPTAWKILSGYLPPMLDRRELTLQRKRQEYFNFIKQYYAMHEQDLHRDTFRQIAIDIPRMSPLIPLFHQEVVQQMFERILFIWAIRHPASGYVQGINDLVTPFFVVFLSEFLDKDTEVDTCDIASLPSDVRDVIEADCFWCFSKLLDGIQDNYTFAQPGIQVKVNALKELVSRIDNELHIHLQSHNVEYLQFSFRWMNNLLMREVPLRCIIRIWDTCLSETDGFASFHLYICAAFLIKFSSDLKREKDFQGLMLMLQNLPTHHWNNEEIGLILAEAYKLKYMFADAPNHLQAKS